MAVYCKGEYGNEKEYFCCLSYGGRASIGTRAVVEWHISPQGFFVGVTPNQKNLQILLL
jgi:hypothetical protein